MAVRCRASVSLAPSRLDPERGEGGRGAVRGLRPLLPPLPAVLYFLSRYQSVSAGEDVSRSWPLSQGMQAQGT